MPPKKGKGKSKKKKKDNLTEEQKKKLAEQKALAEQEKIARRREVTNAFLKLKKEKEYGLIKLNMNKLLDVWRPKLRKLKIEELLDDYKMMRNAFERAFDKKNQLMQELRDALDKNQADYDAAVDSHMHNIDKMMEFWKKRLTEVRDSYGVQRRKLISKLTEEMNRIQNYQDRSVKQLQNSLNQVQNHFKEQTADAKADFAIREEEIRNKGMEEMHFVKNRMDQRMNAMWNDMQERLVSYDVSIAGKKAEYIEFRDKDAAMSEIIDAQFRRLQFLRDGITQVTRKTALFDKALNHYLQELTRKKTEYRDHYDSMMKTHNHLMSTSSSAIKLLAVKTTEVQDRMDTMLTHRERLLKLIERCRQRERMDEKLDPFLVKWQLSGDERRSASNSARVYELPGEDYGESAEMYPEDGLLPSNIEFMGEYPIHDCVGGSLVCDHQGRCQCVPEGDEVEPELAPLKNLIDEFSVLEKFWIRYNRVSLERAALGVRREALMRDNCHLKAAVRNYMGGLNPIMHDLNTFPEDIARKRLRNDPMQRPVRHAHRGRAF